NTLGEELVRYAGVPPSKLRTVYASADERFRPVTDTDTLSQVRGRYSLPFTPFLLMVVKGHQVLAQVSGKELTPRKNVVAALQAYGIMRQRARDTGAGPVPPLVILGIGIAERLTPELVAQYTDPAAVYTAGFVEFRDMAAVYSLARALVFPSIYESFGIPLVEAMACGCPVITSNTSACPEVVGDAALLVDPGDVEGLASAMARVSFDDALAETLCRRGRTRASAFSWIESARTLLGEIRRAAGAD
ncbi:MAG TPA: glycosyltransferase family 1 protein, partial [Gemmatimonadales bacterium]